LVLIEQAQELVAGSIVDDAALGSIRAGLLAMQGRPDDARAEMARARDLWGELGDPSAMTITFLATGIMEMILGSPDRAETGYREGVELLDRLGETAFNSTFLAGLASALCEQGRFDQAEEIARRSQALTAEGDFASEAGWRQAQALVLSSRGDHDAASAMADEAVGFVQETDYVGMIGDAHEVRGRVLVAAGRRDAARAAFQQALASLERKDIVPQIARIREEIASLPS
jgi:tetratricopeptide (TPR) repeat protein